MQFALIHTESVDGFTIRFFAAPEDIDPAGQFHDPQDVADILEGRLARFVAKVTASKLGVELASDYLGGCAYRDVSDFVRESGGYYDDMRNAVIKDARNTINQLK